jgi:ketosteroid isomerase-like protein
MANSRSSLFATLVGVSLLGVAGVPSAIANDARTTVDKLNQSFMAALQKGDVEALKGLYSPNATMFPPGAPPIVGTAAIGGFWKKMVEAGVKRIEPRTTELETHGDTLIELGTFEAFREGATPIQKGRYVVIWKKENGSWKIFRDLWNTETPPTPQKTGTGS